ncbi:MAG: hypothetical protein ACM3NO_06160 [Deltaproteobacteria bacterium]
MPQIRDHSLRGQRSAKLNQPANQAQHKPQKVKELFAALTSEKARVKFGALKALRQMGELEPDLLYPHFDLLVALLRSENSILRWNAMLILGDLARVDRGGRIEWIIDNYLEPISGPHLIDAANTMRGATAIATAKPHLADRVSQAILNVERATYDTPECRNVAIGHAISCLDRLVPMIADTRATQLFVTRQLDNGRPATRKKAEHFLRKWPLRHSA